MREKLIEYIDLLFAGVHNAADIKQEILQNTLDRYDDLISQGKAPEAAYQLAISGIGDISEILNSKNAQAVTVPEVHAGGRSVQRKILQAVAIFLYIICPIPLFVLQDEAGLCLLLALVGVATAMIIISGSKNKTQMPAQDSNAYNEQSGPQKQLTKAIDSAVWSVGLCAYFIISFWTQAWYITWVIFPLIGAVQGLIHACIDLKEACSNEA